MIPNSISNPSGSSNIAAENESSSKSTKSATSGKTKQHVHPESGPSDCGTGGTGGTDASSLASPVVFDANENIDNNAEGAHTNNQQHSTHFPTRSGRCPLLSKVIQLREIEKLEMKKFWIKHFDWYLEFSEKEKDSLKTENSGAGIDVSQMSGLSDIDDSDYECKCDPRIRTFEMDSKSNDMKNTGIAPDEYELRMKSVDDDDEEEEEAERKTSVIDDSRIDSQAAEEGDIVGHNGVDFDSMRTIPGSGEPPRVVPVVVVPQVNNARLNECKNINKIIDDDAKIANIIRSRLPNVINFDSCIAENGLLTWEQFYKLLLLLPVGGLGRSATTVELKNVFLSLYDEEFFELNDIKDEHMICKYVSWMDIFDIVDFPQFVQFLHDNGNPKNIAPLLTMALENCVDTEITRVWARIVNIIDSDDDNDECDVIGSSDNNDNSDGEDEKGELACNSGICNVLNKLGTWISIVSVRQVGPRAIEVSVDCDNCGITDNYDNNSNTKGSKHYKYCIGAIKVHGVKGSKVVQSYDLKINGKIVQMNKQRIILCGLSENKQYKLNIGRCGIFNTDVKKCFIYASFSKEWLKKSVIRMSSSFENNNNNKSKNKNYVISVFDLNHSSMVVATKHSKNQYLEIEFFQPLWIKSIVVEIVDRSVNSKFKYKIQPTQFDKMNVSILKDGKKRSNLVNLNIKNCNIECIANKKFSITNVDMIIQNIILSSKSINTISASVIKIS